MPTLTIESDEPIIVLTLSEYEALIETLEILSKDSSILEEIEKSRQAIAEGKGVTLKALLKELQQ